MEDLKWVQEGKKYKLYINGECVGKVLRLGLVTSSYFKVYKGTEPIGSRRRILPAKMLLEQKVRESTIGTITIITKTD